MQAIATCPAMMTDRHRATRVRAPPPTGDPEETWVPPPPPPARARVSTGEVLIYALAALVFLASVAGLFLLLRTE